MGAAPPRAAARHMRSVSPRHSDPHSVSGMHALFLRSVHAKAPFLGRTLLPPISRGVWVPAVPKRVPKPRAGQAVRMPVVYGHTRVLAHTQPGRVAAMERRRGRGDRRGSYAKWCPGITEVPALPCRVLAVVLRHSVIDACRRRCVLLSRLKTIPYGLFKGVFCAKFTSQEKQGVGVQSS